MVPLTWQMVVDAAAESIGASKSEVMGAIKQPLHPASMRDEFAMAALSGMLATPHNWPQQDADEFAGAAYRFADAMLEARNANR